jgi:hypothetical protein
MHPISKAAAMITTSKPDPHSPDLGDWRLEGAFWVTALNDQELPSPIPGRLTTVYRDKAKQVAFPTPSAAALHLNIAWRSAHRAVKLKRRLILASGSYSDDLPARIELEIPDAYSSILFDYFEEMISVAYGCFSAVEAHCNEVIASHVKGRIEIKRGKEKRHMDALQLERELSVDEKLKLVVCQTLGVPPIAGTAKWEHYLNRPGIPRRLRASY